MDLLRLEEWVVYIQWAMETNEGEEDEDGFEINLCGP
jgi:hypothetical protein